MERGVDGAERIRDEDWNSCWGDTGWKGIARVGSCAGGGRDWSHGHAVPRTRLANAADLVIGIGTRYFRFHFSLDDGVSESGGEVRQHQHCGVRCVQGGRDSRGRGCARGAGTTGLCARGSRGERAVCSGDCGTARRLGCGSGPALPSEEPRKARNRANDWRDVGGSGRARCAAFGAGSIPAICTAVAHAHAQRLPHGIRLLVHGV